MKINEKIYINNIEIWFKNQASFDIIKSEIIEIQNMAFCYWGKDVVGDQSCIALYARKMKELKSILNSFEKMKEARMFSYEYNIYKENTKALRFKLWEIISLAELIKIEMIYIKY